MTLFCVTNDDIPGIGPCTVLGQHVTGCPGPVEEGGTCRGCAPMPATVGMLCGHCFELLQHIYARWDRWRALADASEGRAVSPQGGGRRSVTLGHANITLMFQDIDVCERLLKTRGDRTLTVWVSDLEGAKAAIQFAHAARTAYDTHELEEREKRTPPPARCGNCGLRTNTRNTEHIAGAFTVVKCQHCGHVIDKIRTGPAPWAGSTACESENGADHTDCTDVDCSCFCHHYGPKSRRAGITAMWDGDVHLAAPGSAPRQEWVITDPHTITRITEERKTA